MADLGTGLPPNDIDLTGKGIQKINYATDEYDKTQGITSINYSAKEYNEEKEKPQISAISFKTDTFEGTNFVTYT